MQADHSDSFSLEESLLNFERTLESFAKPLLDKLETGIDKSYSLDLLGRLKIYNTDLITLYNWRNGIKDAWQYRITHYDLCSFGKFLSLDPNVSLYLAGRTSGIHSKHLFPVMTNLAGDYLFYDLNNKSKSYGMLLLFSPAIQVTKPQTAFDSLSSFFNSISQCYQKGIYKLDPANCHLDIDFEKEHELCKLTNPKSKYWLS